MAAIEIIGGFNVSASDPLDARTVVADEAARLAVKWVFRGMLIFQEDTDETWKYTGTPPSNILGDWVELGEKGEPGTTWFNGTGAPAPGLGNDGDYYLDNDPPNNYYQKITGTWTVQGNLQGDPGPAGPQGPEGDQYRTTSTDNITIPVAHPTNVNLTVETGLAYTPAQSLIISNDASNYFNADVVSYDSGTGALSVDSTAHTGSGTFSSWDINLGSTPGTQGPPGPQGDPGIALIHTEGDIDLTDTKVSTVQAGSYTPEAPYSASVFVDNRANLGVPTGIPGDMQGHSISYNGTDWFDNGVWRGPQGPIGLTGPQGDPGGQGVAGLGWTGGSYNPATGIVTFTSTDGLGFATTDLRGADGSPGGTGPAGDDGDNVQVFTGAATPSGTIREGDVWLPGV